MEQEKKWEVKINPKWCKKCGLCVAFCPRKVLEMKEGPQIKDIGLCTGCLMCEMHCPDFAIKVTRREEL